MILGVEGFSSGRAGQEESSVMIKDGVRKKASVG